MVCRGTKRRSNGGWAKAAGSRLWRLVACLRRDQRGSIGIASVFALILLTVLLGMVINSVRQVDQKVKMQNAADAAAYSGGVVLARAMNTLAFTNHLLSDVFALTAFMREARDRSAESITPETLEHWARIAPHLASSEFDKFARLGAAIPDKLPLEADLVRTYSDLHAAISERMLPVLEEILAQEMIPTFQRTLVAQTPRLAQQCTAEVARRHGVAWPDSQQLYGVLWRADGFQVGQSDVESDWTARTIPAVDPTAPGQQQLIEQARQQRRRMAEAYLGKWNREKLWDFDHFGKMSQFSNLWRIFTCGQLHHLLDEEYPYRNLPFQIRSVPGPGSYELERQYMFVAVVYKEKLEEAIPVVFRNPIEADNQAFAQVSVFVPTRRLVRGSVPDPVTDAAPDVVRQDWWPWLNRKGELVWHHAGSTGGCHPIAWSLITQNWTTQLVPATCVNLAAILSSPPEIEGADQIDVPDLTALSPAEMDWINHH